MPYTASEKNAIADYEVSRGGWYGVHTANPTDVGSSEAAGGGYARQQPSFAAAAAGSAQGAQVVIPVPAGTFTHWSRWSAATAGVLREYGAFAASQGNPSAPSEIKLTPAVGPVA